MGQLLEPLEIEPHGLGSQPHLAGSGINAGIAQIAAKHSNGFIERVACGSFGFVRPEQSDQMLPSTPSGRTSQIHQEPEMFPPEELGWCRAAIETQAYGTEGLTGDHGAHRWSSESAWTFRAENAGSAPLQSCTTRLR